MTKKLLLADDSATIQKVVHLTFAAEDVQIEFVPDGEQAIAKAREFRPDIVLADVFMPGRNGYQVCESIKSDPQLAGTPVLLLVGTFEMFDEAEAARVKCDGHLTKPLDTAELVRVVFSLIKKTSSGNGKKKSRTNGNGLVSSRARESFLGSGRILDLFGDSPAPVSSEPKPAEEERDSASGARSSRIRPADSGAASPQVIPFPSARTGVPEGVPPLTEEALDSIVEKVVRRISEEVVREIAWEVVPEISEAMIRRYLNGREFPKS